MIQQLRGRGQDGDNPATGSFSVVGSLNHASYDHAAVLRSDGTVLVVGGTDLAQPSGLDAVPNSGLSRVEIYGPSTKVFAPAGTMRYPRCLPTATTLSTGDVLIVNPMKLLTFLLPVKRLRLVTTGHHKPA